MNALKRYWYEKDSNIAVDHNGFLLNPNTIEGQYYNNTLIRLENNSLKSCLILLGGPGEGKSYSIKEQYEILELPKSQKMFFDLGRYGTKKRLEQKIFNDKTIIDWKNGNYKLYLFLDGLDEGLLINEELNFSLIDEIEDLPIDRLHLIITCRRNEWSLQLEKELIDIFKVENIKILELAPLLEEDVEKLLLMNSIDFNNFHNELITNNILELASKPMTLQMLIDIYLNDNHLPKGIEELYEKATWRLLTENNPNYGKKSIDTDFDKNDMLLIASRVAAMSTLGNKSTIIKDDKLDTFAEEDLRLIDIAGNAFRDIKSISKINEHKIIKVLSSALFTSQGEGKVKWVHQNYANFLTSFYIEKNNFEDKQIENIILNSQNKIHPQLKDLSSWIVINRTEIFKKVVNIDPFVMIKSDLSNISESNKERIIFILLNSIKNEEIIDVPYSIILQLKKLNHQNIINQLDQYINKNNKNILSRKTAYQIALACKLTNYLETAIAVALSTKEEAIIRESAARLVKEIGDDSQKLMLEPLIMNSKEMNDPYQQLKGIALFSLFPDIIDINKVLIALERDNNENFFGEYSLFIISLPEMLSNKDLNLCLEWGLDNINKWIEEQELYRFIQNIIKKAWGVYIETPKSVSLNLVKTITTVIIKQNSNNFFIDLNEFPHSKRKLLEDIIDYLNFESEDFNILIRKWFAHQEEIEWFIDRLENTQDPIKQKKWILLISVKLMYSPNKASLVWKVAGNYSELKSQTNKQFEAIALESEKAKLNKQINNLAKSNKKNNEQDYVSNLERNILLIEEGRRQYWINISSILSESQNVVDLTRTNRFIELDSSMQSRILNIAKEYIVNCTTFVKAEIAMLYPPIIGKINAFLLIFKLDKEYLQKVDEIEWEQLIPHLLTYSITISSNDKELLKMFIVFIFEKIPTEFILSMKSLFEMANEKGKNTGIIENIEYCINEDINSTLIESSQNKNLRSELTGEIFSALKYPNTESIQEFGIGVIKDYFKKTHGEISNIHVIAQNILLHCNNEVWENIWGYIETETQFGVEVMRKISYQNIEFNKLSYENLKKLYVWLRENFPIEHDRNKLDSDAYYYTSRDHIEDLRNNTFDYLVQRGSKDSLKIVQEIVELFPTLDMKYKLEQAIEKVSLNEWVSLQPFEIIKLAEAQYFRFVENEKQLLDVVLENLKEIEYDLHNKDSNAYLLWNEVKNKSYKPKNENQYSTYIKNRLEEKLKYEGIIINREVELRSQEDHLRGERTDIQIDTTTKNGFIDSRSKTISIIIEVKGNWNREVTTAMEDQLANRYLNKSGIQTGIYLIGWFDSDSWDEENRKINVKKLKKDIGDIDQLKCFLEEQSESLSKNQLRIEAYIMDVSYLKE